MADSQQPQKTPFGFLDHGGGKMWWLGIIVLAMVAMTLGAGLFIQWAGDDESAPSGSEQSRAPSPGVAGPSPVKTSAGTGSSGPQQSGRVGCAGDASAKPLPQGQAPSGTSWVPIDGILYPKTKAGPASTTGGVRRCFTHDQPGAVAMATNTMLTVLGGPPEKARAALREQFTPGALREQALANPGSSDPTSSLELRAYRVRAYSPDTAQIEVVLRMSAAPDVELGSQVTVHWVKGDWKIDGARATSPAPVTSMAGYTVWSANP